MWEYGPSGFHLREPAEAAKVSDEQVREALLAYLATDPHNQAMPKLPPTRDSAVATVAATAKAPPDQVRQVLTALVEAGTVRAEELVQPGKHGPRPLRVRLV